MASPKKTPPKFNEKMSYPAWGNKIKMWEIVTSVDKKERAIVVLLDTLEGNVKAENCTRLKSGRTQYDRRYEYFIK